jgi:hypothetical protein
MGPKKDTTSSKSEKKKQEKIIEDRTFGLKNKNKSKAVQKYIKGVEQVVKGAGRSAAAETNEMYAERQAKKKRAEEDAFLNSLYKTVNVIKQEVPEDENMMKTVLCAYFKAGMCDKGDDCEFSHDLNIEFNQGAFDIYTDLRSVKNKTQDSELNRIAEEREAKRSKKSQSNIVKYFK